MHYDYWNASLAFKRLTEWPQEINLRSIHQRSEKEYGGVSVHAYVCV